MFIVQICNSVLDGLSLTQRSPLSSPRTSSPLFFKKKELLWGDASIHSLLHLHSLESRAARMSVRYIPQTNA